MISISRLTKSFNKKFGKKQEVKGTISPIPTVVAVPVVAPATQPIVPKVTPAPIITENTMTQLVTAANLRQIFTTTPLSTLELFVDPINKYCTEHDINTRNRMASFLSQVGHESAGFTTLKENLNYSKDALLRVFPKYFKSEALAERYARNPSAIGSRVYANRMGNGPESSGDGFKHRGFGAIQLTGKQNQSRFAFWIKKTLDDAIEYLQTPEGAILGAIWFWETNNLNAIADKGEAGVTELTRRINGGTNGLADRLTKFKKSYKLLDHLP